MYQVIVYNYEGKKVFALYKNNELIGRTTNPEEDLPLWMEW